MSGIIGTSGGNKTMVGGVIGTSGGNKQILAAYVGTPGGNKVWFTSTPPTVVASPNNVSGETPAVNIAGFTDPTTVVVTGGIGPYTYSWSRVSGSTVVSANSPSAATTNFSGLPPSLQTRSAVFQCTVTDTATGLVGVSNTVTASIDNPF